MTSAFPFRAYFSERLQVNHIRGFRHFHPDLHTYTKKRPEGLFFVVFDSQNQTNSLSSKPGDSISEPAQPGNTASPVPGSGRQFQRFPIERTLGITDGLHRGADFPLKNSFGFGQFLRFLLGSKHGQPVVVDRMRADRNTLLREASHSVPIHTANVKIVCEIDPCLPIMQQSVPLR